MHIAVTGSSGFIANHLIPLLLRDGHSVAGVDRRPGRWTQYEQDLADPAAGSQWADGADVIVHMAATASVSGCADTHAALNDNVVAAYNVACVAKSRHLVAISSAAVYGGLRQWAPFSAGHLPRPENAYGRSKAAMEHVVCMSSRNVSIIRPFNVLGPGGAGVINQWCRDARESGLIRVAKYGVRDYIPVQDVAAAIARIASRREATTRAPVNVCTGVPVELDLLSHLFLHAYRSRTGKSIEVVEAADGGSLWSVGNPEWMREEGLRPSMTTEEAVAAIVEAEA